MLLANNKMTPRIPPKAFRTVTSQRTCDTVNWTVSTEARREHTQHLRDVPLTRSEGKGLGLEGFSLGLLCKCQRKHALWCPWLVAETAVGSALERSMLMCTEVEARLITEEGGSQKGGREGRGRGREDAAGGWWSFKSRNGDSPLIWPFVNFRGGSGAGFLRWKEW